MHEITARGAAVVAAVSSAMLAQAAAAAEPDAAALQGLAACRAISAPAEKADCYDLAAAALERAVRAGELILVQKKEAQAAQRSAFGFSIPALAIFDRSGEVARPLESIIGEVRRAHRDPLGQWVVEFTDGAVWRQTDEEVIAPPPRPGSRVEIRRAAFGSYMMKIDGRRGVRAKRAE